MHFHNFLQKQYTIAPPYLNGRKLPRPSELDRDEAVEVGVEERMHDVLLTSEQPPEPDSLSDCWPPLFVAIMIKMHSFDTKTVYIRCLFEIIFLGKCCEFRQIIQQKHIADV